MAGGTFSSMNKVRPGAYINFDMNSQSEIMLGSRGIATVAMELDWGAKDALINLYANDLLTSASLAKVGLLVTDAGAKLIKLALQNCALLKIYKTNTTGGDKATKTLTGGLVITAKYEGTFGNKIAIVIKAADTKFIVETYADGYAVDSQRVATIAELKPNDFVTFSGTGTLAATASTLLTGGANGTTSTLATEYEKYFSLLRVEKWHTMAVPTTDTSTITAVVNFIDDVRQNDGRYVQAVVSAPSDTAIDTECIINNVCGVVLDDDVNVTASDFTYWVAGATAGADIAESLTGKVVNGAKNTLTYLSNDAIIEGIKKGHFILSLNQNGSVKVEKDINSLHTFTSEKSYIFSKNRVVRELDEIGSAIEDIWETTYLGRVSNNDNGRTLFKSSIIDYLSKLADKGAIQDFDSSQVTVIAGEDIDSVIANIAVKPVDSMEFLYMTINVGQ